MRKFAMAGLMMAGLLTGRQAWGMITLQETAEPISPALQANGWMGIKLSLAADSASGKISAIEFKNNVLLNWNPLTDVRTWEFPVGTAIGISGPVHQSWTAVDDDGDGATDEVIPTPTGTFSSSSSGTTRVDSYFLSSSVIFTEDVFNEDNDLSESKTDGVGSFMTFSGGILKPNQTSTMDVAFLIVPVGGNDVTLRGMVGDSNGNIFGIDSVLNPGSFSQSASVQAFALTMSVPEPATIGLAAIGAATFLKRRRR